MAGKGGGRVGGRAWTSDEVAEALGIRSPGTASFSGISTDTRHLTPYTLFVALKGERFDAHQFLAAAAARGAIAAVVRRGTTPVAGLSFVEVGDPLEAFGLLARGRLLQRCGLGGRLATPARAGRRSTKGFKSRSRPWQKCATTANLSSNLVGVPLTILTRRVPASSRRGSSVPE
jgi:UDP-N-acetylmuramoyl-tripeptide--D-alanyl-D-alanine ligase